MFKLKEVKLNQEYIKRNNLETFFEKLFDSIEKTEYQRFAIFDKGSDWYNLVTLADFSEKRIYSIPFPMFLIGIGMEDESAKYADRRKYTITEYQRQQIHVNFPFEITKWELENLKQQFNNHLNEEFLEKEKDFFQSIGVGNIRSFKIIRVFKKSDYSFDKNVGTAIDIIFDNGVWMSDFNAHQNEDGKIIMTSSDNRCVTLKEAFKYLKTSKESYAYEFVTIA